MRVRTSAYVAVLCAAGFASADAAAPIPCGSHLFTALPESFFREDVSRAKPARNPVVGAKETLWIQNFAAGQLEEVSVTCRAVNRRSVILVADACWSALPSATAIDPADVTRLSAAFEENAGSPAPVGKGIYDVLTTAFAPVNPVGGDSLVYIALTEIKSNYTGGYIVGYVSPNDRVDPSLYDRSNFRNLVVLDGLSRTTAVQRERTLAHEFLHVIHMGIDRYEERWIDEGIAVLAQVLCGYQGNTGREFFANTGIGLFNDGTATPSLGDYDKSYMIMQYLADQFGVQTIGEIVRSPQHGISGIDAVLASRGFSSRFERDVFPDWTVANLLPPARNTPGRYAWFDARAAFPGDFGRTAFPCSLRDTLASYGVRYLRAAEQTAQGTITVSSGGVWNIRSVENSEAVTNEPVIRSWFPSGTKVFRDCSLRQPWLVIAPTGMVTVNHVMDLSWQAPGTLNPVAEQREPLGTGTDIYRARIKLIVSNVDPGQDVRVVVSSARTGVLDRDLRILRSGLKGTCGETLEMIDSSDAPLPADDVIRVTVSDLHSPFGGVLSTEELSWSFGTGEADLAAPNVVINLLGNPVLPAYVTALVLSDEPLYRNGTIPVSLLVNGTTVVELVPRDSTGMCWVGNVALTSTGAFDFVLRAVDLAGNSPAQPSATYAALTPGGGVARVVSGSGGEPVEFTLAPGTGGGMIVLARVFADGSIWLGPDGARWTIPVRVALPRAWGSRGNALQSVTTGHTEPFSFDPTRGRYWVVLAEPGTYRITNAAGRPVEFSLGQNAPNPFNPSTRIPVSIPARYEGGRLEVFTVEGQLVRSFAVAPGRSSVEWDGLDETGKGVASGIFLARLTAIRDGLPAETRVRRMVVVR